MRGDCNGCLSPDREIAHGSICVECAAAARAWEGSEARRRIPRVVGARLRELRLGRGISQAEIAERTGIHRPIVSRIERGVHVASLDTVQRFAAAIGVDPVRDVLVVLDDVVRHVPSMSPQPTAGEAPQP